jgi:hypothetical protein
MLSVVSMSPLSSLSSKSSLNNPLVAYLTCIPDFTYKVGNAEMPSGPPSA